MPEITRFTFHNVSINTVKSSAGCMDLINLHSTMFLLILEELKELRAYKEKNLHSTMFLLIRPERRYNHC